MAADNQTLYVAGRGDTTDPVGGLYRFSGHQGDWSGELLAAVVELSSLAHHPRLPVVYGTSGTPGDGRLHAWRIDAGGAVPLAEVDSGGSVPCFVCVHPSGRLVIVTNYTSGTVASWSLDDDGIPTGAPAVIALDGGGSGVEPDRQDLPHPHQAVLLGDELLVPDLGADLVRRFAVDAEGIGDQLEAFRVPPGTGPRHLAVGPDGVLVVSGELAQTFVVLAGSKIATVASTRLDGAGRSRPPRNYPGDLQVSGVVGYLANRGYDTIGVIRLDDESQLIAEVNSGVHWPQHLLVADGRLYVAGWDSSQVVSLSLDPDGVPGEPEECFSCPGAAWLLPAGPVSAGR